MRLTSVLGIIILAVTPLAADAQLSLTFTPPELSVRPGDSLTFSGTLLNNGTTETFLNGVTYSLGSADFTLDPTLFLINAPTSLLSNQSYSGNLFTLTVAPSALFGITPNTFTITGGSTLLDQNSLVTTEFRVGVVPEPGNQALLIGAGIGSVSVFVRRRRLRGK